MSSELKHLLRQLNAECEAGNTWYALLVTHRITGCLLGDVDKKTWVPNGAESKAFREARELNSDWQAYGRAVERLKAESHE